MLAIEPTQTDFLNKKVIDTLEQELLPIYLKQCRWFGGKARPIRHVEILEAILMLSQEDEKFYLFVLQVFYEDASSELYQLPFSHTIAQAEQIKQNFPKAVIGEYQNGTEQGIMYDAIFSETYRLLLWKMILGNQNLITSSGKMFFEAGEVVSNYANQQTNHIPTSRVLTVEQSNTSVIYDEKFFLKLYRKLDKAINPDLEINRFFAQKTNYKNVPAFGGAIEIREPNQEPIVLAMMQEMIENQGDAWTLLLGLVEQYYEKVLQLPKAMTPPIVWDAYSFDFKSVHKDLQDLISKEVYDKIALLGKRTAEMHLALASNPDVADFAPKKFTTEYQTYLTEHLTSSIKDKLQFLQSIRPHALPNVKTEIDKVLAVKDKILATIAKITQNPITTQRIRMHGDYHLGQVLFTGTDFMIIDFEGEPATPFKERRVKHSPLKDVAGMVRSFHYAVYATLLQNEKFKHLDHKKLNQWAEIWYLCARGFYLESYFSTIANTELIPKDKQSMEVLLKAFLMEKAIYELCYEANNRPAWLVIPLNGVLKLAVA
jgi:maltose alpha-D-glucosyltransferase/alpha-amylase